MKSRSLLVVLLTLSGVALHADDSVDMRALEHFEKRIRPVLVAHCYQCHSAEAMAEGELKGGLLLDTRAGLLRGGESGAAIIAGDVNGGTLLAALRHESVEMPPDQKLPENVIADFEQWIRDAAVDPREGAEAAVSLPNEIDFDAARKHWSLQPVRRPDLPLLQLTDWPQTRIDTFVLARLEESGLAPAADATATTLLRRLYFDLTGLPPRPEDVAAFLAAATEDRSTAVREVVEQLLASPHFGERWGRHWLDVVRFAESNGRDINTVWHEAWRYRRWVIASFNEDKPFDRFVKEQIAGDLLPATSREQRDEQVIATAMLAMTPKLIEESDTTLFRMNQIDDQIEVVTRAFLGLSVSCARCHDHKFDPIPTRDYYALAGVFLSTEPLYGFGRLGSRTAIATDLVAVGAEADALGPAGLEYRRKLVEQSQDFQTARSDRYRVVKQIGGLKAQLEDPAADRAVITASIAEKEQEVTEWDARIKQMDEALNALKRSPPPQPGWTLAVRDVSAPSDCTVYIRGETKNPGEQAPRGVLQVISTPGIPPIEPAQSGRLQLAEWLASPHNPLTPRVIANRVWSHLFGDGIVTSVDDLGVTGSMPSHPELLDDLAWSLVDSGWSIKQLIRSIVLSRTYQQGASASADAVAADPGNVLLGRFRPRRLEAEPFRDAVLSVAGVLDRSPPVQPFLARWNAFETDNVTIVDPFITSEMMEWEHRTVYLPVIREVLPDVLRLFDFADPNAVVGRRDVSTLPAQSLFLMNSDWIALRAQQAAGQLAADAGLTDSERVDLLYCRAYGRLPADDERTQALDFVATCSEAAIDDGAPADSSAAIREDPWSSLCQTVFCSAEFWMLK